MKPKTFFFVLMALAVLLAGFARPAPALAADDYVCTAYHTVQRGEYLAKIAQKYGVSWRWLAEINNLTNPSRIYAGQKLCVEVEKVPVEQVCVAYYTVQRGDYLVKIANKYGVTWRWLAEINNLDNPSKIYPGQKLCVELGEGDDDDNPAPVHTPTFSITKVVEDRSVTIQTKDFPANVNFDVLMGRMGTRGIDGIKVATINSGKGGTFSMTFDIPDALRDRRQIAIRLESPSSGYFAYNWFWNATAP